MNNGRGFHMLIRNCAGGLVFRDDRVLLVRQRNGDWGFPKEIIRRGKLSYETALEKVRDDIGVVAEIVSTAGFTNYEVSSVSRKKPVCDKTTWYIMESFDRSQGINDDSGTDGGFFNVEKAMELVPGSQDKALLHLFHNKYRSIHTAQAV